MSWLDVCGWTTSIFDKRKDVETDAESRKTEPRTETVPIVMRQPLPRPSVHIDRDLPPVPPIPPSVYEMGLASPRGLTRSNSRSSMRSTKTTASAKSRRQMIQQGRRPTIGTPSDFRKVEGAMPYTNASGFRGNETGEASPRPSTALESPFSPLELSIHRGGAKLSPLPSFSNQLPRKSRTLENRPARTSSLAASNPHRRSISAPIPVRSSSTHMIPRKPVVPKAPFSKPEAKTRTSIAKRTSTYNDFSMKIAIEADDDSDGESLFEVESKPRTQSYYADAGAALLASTLNAEGPARLKISRARSSPNLSSSTSKSKSPRKSTVLTETDLVSSPPPLSAKSFPKSSPKSEPTSYIIKPTKKVTRSKSVGPFPMPPDHSRASTKRRSLEVALPQLPRSVYIPTPATTFPSVLEPIGSFSTVRPRSYSVAKSATTAPSSKRSSAASDMSLLSSDTRTSYSSLASAGIAANPVHAHLRRDKNKDRDSDKYIAIPFTLAEAPSAVELPISPSPSFKLSPTFSSTLSPPTLRPTRRSTQAPIPVTPVLPNSTFTVPSGPPKSPKVKAQGRRQPITRSTSTENIRARRTERERARREGDGIKRSKSYYDPGLGLGMMGLEDELNLLPLLVRPLRAEKGVTIAAVEKEATIDERKTEEVTAQEVEDMRVEEPLKDEANVPTAKTDEIEKESRWGRGIGAEWGVVY